MFAAAEVLLAAHDKFVASKVDSSRLSRMALLFDASTVLLDCFAESSATSTLKTAVSSHVHLSQQGQGMVAKMASLNHESQPAVKAQFALKELRDQIDMHAEFKEKRLQAFGWEWTPEDRNVLALSDLSKGYPIGFAGADLSMSPEASSDASSPGGGAFGGSTFAGFAGTAFAHLLDSDGHREVYTPAKSLSEAVSFIPVSLPIARKEFGTGPSSSSSAFTNQMREFIGSIRRDDEGNEVDELQHKVIAAVAQMEALLQPQEGSITSLVMRISNIAQSLYRHADLYEVRGYDDEADRLRNLGAAVESPLDKDDLFPAVVSSRRDSTLGSTGGSVAGNLMGGSLMDDADSEGGGASGHGSMAGSLSALRRSRRGGGRDQERGVGFEPLPYDPSSTSGGQRRRDRGDRRAETPSSSLPPLASDGEEGGRSPSPLGGVKELKAVSGRARLEQACTLESRILDLVEQVRAAKERAIRRHKFADVSRVSLSSTRAVDAFVSSPNPSALNYQFNLSLFAFVGGKFGFGFAAIAVVAETASNRADADVPLDRGGLATAAACGVAHPHLRFHIPQSASHRGRQHRDSGAAYWLTQVARGYLFLVA